LAAKKQQQLLQLLQQIQVIPPGLAAFLLYLRKVAPAVILLLMVREPAEQDQPHQALARLLLPVQVVETVPQVRVVLVARVQTVAAQVVLVLRQVPLEIPGQLPAAAVLADELPRTLRSMVVRAQREG